MTVRNKIILVAPSKKISKDVLDIAIKNTKSLGFKPIYRKDVQEDDIYFAGSVTRRVKEVNNAFSSKESKFVFCIRGGYGSMELLNRLNWNKILKSKKTFVGYSDITALLIGFYFKNYKGLLVHGQMPGSKNWCGKDKYLKFYKKCFLGKDYQINVPSYSKIINDKNFSGEIVGGNLRILSHLISTKYKPSFKNKIFFIEDVNERPAAIYNMLLQLEMMGLFKEVKALLIGRMINCGDYLLFIEKFISRLNIPVIYELPIGHEKETIPIRLGDKVCYDKKSKTINFKNNKNN